MKKKKKSKTGKNEPGQFLNILIIFFLTIIFGSLLSSYGLYELTKTARIKNYAKTQGVIKDVNVHKFIQLNFFYCSYIRFIHITL